VKPKTFYRHYQNVSIFCFKKYESLLAAEDCTRDPKEARGGKRLRIRKEQNYGELFLSTN